jgi:hypothetical protein
VNIRDLGIHRLVYLASPYSLYPHGLDRACDDVCEVAGHLISAGVRVFSPVAHSHPIAMASGIDPLDQVTWLELDEAIAPSCGALVVAELEGWDKSDGVAKEIKWFATRPIYYLNPKTMELRK